MRHVLVVEGAVVAARHVHLAAELVLEIVFVDVPAAKHNIRTKDFRGLKCHFLLDNQEDSLQVRPVPVQALAKRIYHNSN